jgi:ABC-type uncharacterized transport system permease subunit
MTTINTARPVTRPVAAWRDQLPTLIRVYGIILTLVLLVAVVGIGNPAFLSAQNIFNMVSQWAPAGIMAVGMTFVILTGGFDLSVASGYSLCAVVAGYVGQSYPPSIAFAAAIVVGLLFGLANGLLVAVVRINPFITTVGSGFVINGVALVMTKNAAFLVDNPDFGTLGAGRWHGVPYSGMLLIVFLLVFGFILARTVYGEAIYSVGGNTKPAVSPASASARWSPVPMSCSAAASALPAASSPRNCHPRRPTSTLALFSMCSPSWWSAGPRCRAVSARCGARSSGSESSRQSRTASCFSISVRTISRSSRGRLSLRRWRSTVA